MGDNATYPDITTMWEAIICFKDPHYEWHAWDYMFGTCGKYGVENLVVYLDEENDHSSSIVWFKKLAWRRLLVRKGRKRKN